MSVINWGIIGLGKIANKFASGFDQLKNSRLYSVASKNIENLEEFQKKYNVSKSLCYGNYEDMLLNESLDIVYIALPNNLHSEWINKCIEYNKNVLVEKPAVVTEDEIKKIINKLNNKQIFFAEGFMYRFHPQTLKFTEIINQNQIGELLKMETSFGINVVNKKNIFGFVKEKINTKSRLFKKELGGGSILDLGCYPTSLSILIASLKSQEFKKEIKLIDTKNLIGPTGVDLEAFSKINFGNGFISTVKSSFKKDLGKVTKIFGSKGEIIIPDTWHCLNPSIIVNGKEININQLYRNIFSYEIESISQSILNGEIIPKFPAIKKEETAINISILNQWINSNEK